MLVDKKADEWLDRCIVENHTTVYYLREKFGYSLGVTVGYF